MLQFEPIFFCFIHHRKEQQLDTSICIITSLAWRLLEGRVSALGNKSQAEPILFSFIFFQSEKNYLLVKVVFPLNMWVPDYIWSLFQFSYISLAVELFFFFKAIKWKTPSFMTKLPCLYSGIVWVSFLLNHCWNLRNIPKSTKIKSFDRREIEELICPDHIVRNFGISLTNNVHKLPTLCNTFIWIAQ